MAADEELLEAAREASQHAYAPYSGLNMGAAVRTERGAIFRGCNVENASYGLTSCAERNAIFASAASAPPCGACRQVLHEFGPAARVLFPVDGQVRVATAAELLPFPFRL